jgi:hypothetical protein
MLWRRQEYLIISVIEPWYSGLSAVVDHYTDWATLDHVIYIFYAEAETNGKCMWPELMMSMILIRCAEFQTKKCNQILYRLLLCATLLESALCYSQGTKRFM